MKKLLNKALTSLRESTKQAPPPVRKRVAVFLGGAIVLLVSLSTFKSVSVSREVASREAEIAAGPQVRVAQALKSPGTHMVSLLGETRPYAEAILYAKVSGYLKEVKADKGDRVKEGDLLAVIESPETDQAYEAALADSRNKSAIDKRMAALFKKRLVSAQEADQARADADVATARLRSAAVLKGYERIRAPFTGTVTARFADPGALLQNATNSQSSALPVVTLSTVDRLRVDVFVDQHDAPYVEKESPVLITMSDRPGFKLTGKLSRVSGELDARTKMLLAEIDLPNDQSQLVPGSFVQVTLELKSPPYIQAPVEALVMRNGNTFVTAVTAQNELTYKQVELANNDGKMLWVASGLDAGETLALNVGDTVPEGGKVRPLPNATPTEKKQ